MMTFLLVLKILGIITISVLVILWAIFTKWSFKNSELKAERLSMQRWFMIVAFLGVFGIYTQWIMFPLAWQFRNKKNQYFSWWLDDSRFGNYNGTPWSKDYYYHLNGRAETFWVAYAWHIRNMIWNLQNKRIFKVKKQTIYIGNQNIKITRGILNKLTDLNNIPKDVEGMFGQFAGLKYWKDGKSGWQIMNGDKISSKHSIVGIAFYFYENEDQGKEDNQLNWAYTECRLVKTWFFGYRWRTIQIGMKQTGYSRQLKYQKDIEIK